MLFIAIFINCRLSQYTFVGEDMSEKETAVDFMGNVITSDKTLVEVLIEDSPKVSSPEAVAQILNECIRDSDFIYTREFKKADKLLNCYARPVLRGINELLAHKCDASVIIKLIRLGGFSYPYLQDTCNAFNRFAWNQGKRNSEIPKYAALLEDEFNDFLNDHDDAVDLENIRDFFSFLNTYENSAVLRTFF